jgi:sulfonate transport system substrate-binding protein
MKKRMKLTRIILLSLVVILSFTGCGSKGTKTETADNKNQAKKVVLGDMLMYYPIKVADKLGYFDEEFKKDGIDIEVKQFSRGAEMVEGFSSKNVDIGLLGDQPVVQGKSNNIDLKIMSTFFTSDTGYGFVATKESGMKTLADMKGKKVGVMIGSTLHQLFLIYLNSAGLTESDVQIVNLTSADTLTSLKANQIDCAVIMEPDMTKAVDSGCTLITNAVGYNKVATVIAGNNEFLANNPEISARVLKVIDKTFKWIEQNQEEAAKIVADATGSTPEVAQLYYKTRENKLGLTQEDVDSIQRTIDFSLDKKLIKNKVDINSLIDDTYLKKAGIK